MLLGKRVLVVMPAYNAARTLERTFQDIPSDVVDEVLLVDDASHDETLEVARRLGIRCFFHERNMGYGRNQKTCYTEALNTEADIVVMVHPDYQYSPKIIPALAGLVASGEYDVAIGSRILGGRARQGGMPVYKYLANRFLTLVENLLLGAKLSEYHTGFRAFSRQVLASLPLWENSDDFVFDNQMLAQVIYFDFRIGEVSCPTRYFPEASSINFSRSAKYGLGVLTTSVQFALARWGLAHPRIFSGQGRGLRQDPITASIPGRQEQAAGNPLVIKPGESYALHRAVPDQPVQENPNLGDEARHRRLAGEEAAGPGDQLCGMKEHGEHPAAPAAVKGCGQAHGGQGKPGRLDAGGAQVLEAAQQAAACRAGKPRRQPEQRPGQATYQRHQGQGRLQ